MGVQKCTSFFSVGGVFRKKHTVLYHIHNNTNSAERSISLDWKQIKSEYIAGGTSYRKLAEKYSVSFSTLKEIARREKWTDLREQAQLKADTKFVDMVGEKQAVRSAKIIDVADKLLDKISKTIDNLDVIDSQSLKHFTSALKDLKDIKGIKSDIDLREQEARINKLQKDAQEETQDKSITIVFGAETEDYSE
jgi:Mor family transcriptional regulator